MPRRTSVRPPANPTSKPRVHRSSGDVYKLLEEKVLPRLARVEEATAANHRVLKAAKILNGDGERLLAQVLEEKSDETKLLEAEAVIAQNKLKKRKERKWLARPKALLWAVLLGVASGIGYAIVIHPGG